MNRIYGAIAALLWVFAAAPAAAQTCPPPTTGTTTGLTWDCIVLYGVK